MKRFLVAVALVVVLASALQSLPAESQTPTPTPTETPTATPTPSPTAGPTGAISGRLYIDVNANGAYDGPDVAWAGTQVQLAGPAYPSTSTSDEGLYTFDGLAPGEYTVSPAWGLPQGCSVIPPFDWMGEDPDPIFCGRGPQLSLPSLAVNLAEGEQLTGADLPQVPPTGITGRIWLDAAPAPTDADTFVTAGGTPCWPAQLTARTGPAGIPYTAFAADLRPHSDPACQSGDLGLLVGDRAIQPGVTWAGLWIDQLWPHSTGQLKEDTRDFMTPPFLGVWGEVFQEGAAGSLLPGDPVGDDTVVRAIVGTKTCGEVSTKTLTDNDGQKLSLFGLIILPDELNTGCGAEGAPVTFCVSDSAASSGSYAVSGGELLAYAAGEIVAVTLRITDEPCPLALPTAGSAPASSASPAAVAVGGAIAAIGAAAMIASRRAGS
jgi:hypothetical protein